MAAEVTLRHRASLVVPLQDEETSVFALLCSIALQRHLPTEVILVDAGSVDRTIALAATSDLPCPLRVVRMPRVFPGTARNKGVEAATSDWIAFTDGGIVLRPDWLQELLAVANQETDVVFGGMEPDCDTFFRECAALAYVPPKDGHGIRGPFIASSLIRRSKFMAVGGFPEYRAAEDLILVERLRTAGARVAYAPKAQVRWQIAGSIGATFGRFANYSYHNLVAGWGRHWHLGVARLYAVLVLAILGLELIGPGLLPWLAVPLFFILRAAKAARVKRRSFAFSTLHPGRVAGAALILVVIDVATALGLLRWLREKLHH